MLSQLPENHLLSHVTLNSSFRFSSNSKLLLAVAAASVSYDFE